MCIVNDIIAYECIKEGNFKLKNGDISRYYFDMKNIISYPSLLKTIGDNIYKMIFRNLIETNLRTKIFGQNIEYYQRLDSTNKEAWELIDSNEAHHGMIIITDNQLAGKGRNGNSWFMSPSKGLALSIILTKKIPLDKAKLIPIGASVSIAKALKNRGCSPELKWPNDILINN